MNYSKEDLIKYRLEKANNCLEEAKEIAKLEHWDTVANRLYYACFYSITAFLAKKDIQVYTHKGIKSAFHLHLIKAENFSKEYGKLFGDLFNKRQEADYKDFIDFEENDISPLIDEVSNFINELHKIIEK